MGTPRQIFSHNTMFQLRQNFKKTQKELTDLLDSDDDGCLRCNKLRCRCAAIKPSMTNSRASISSTNPSAFVSKTARIPIAPATIALPMPVWSDQMVPSVSILDAKDYPGKELRMHSKTCNPNAPYPQIKTIPQPRTPDTPRTVKWKLDYSGSLSGIQQSHDCWQQYRHYGLYLGSSILPRTSAAHTVSYTGDDELIISDLREVNDVSSPLPWSSSGYDDRASSGIRKEFPPTAQGEETGCAFGAIGEPVTDSVKNFFQSFGQVHASPVVMATGRYPAVAVTNVTYTLQVPPPSRGHMYPPYTGYFQYGVRN